MRGELAEAVSRGLMDFPVVFRSPRGPGRRHLFPRIAH